MMKIVFIFFIFYSLSFASDKFGIIDKVYISEDFKTYKLAKYKDYKNKKVEQFSIKVELNKNKISEKTYYLSIVSDYDNLISTNIKYIKNPHQMLIKLDEKTPDNLFFL